MRTPERLTWRRATADDAVALRDLEREANLVALAHVFPPDEHAYPDDGVLARWRTTLADPAVTVDVVEGPACLLALTAYDARLLRHLAVHPDAWGRGLGRAGVERAEAGVAAAGGEELALWCLVENQRALALYRRLGFADEGVTRAAEWPPYPLERRLVRPLRSPTSNM